MHPASSVEAKSRPIGGLIRRWLSGRRRTSPEASESGWYPDPERGDLERYWFGGAWSRQHTRLAPRVGTPDPAPAAPGLPRPSSARSVSSAGQPPSAPAPRRLRGVIAGALVTAVIVVLLVLFASATPTNEPTITTTPATGSSGRVPNGSNPASVSSAPAHVGSALAVTDGRGSRSTVSLLGVIDPARATSPYQTPDNPSRFVSVEIRVTNSGRAALTDDANTDFSVVGSDDQTYTADIVNISGCTNFNAGVYLLAPRASTVGCVTFQLPMGVRIAKVEDLPGGTAYAGSTIGIWRVP